tara:strand:- start:294 stop:593 length:300 start_codon:yes stop_codon:yes gene_type:complete
MLPGVGGVEYLVIAALIIIFVGPKDLPSVLRTFGRWWGKIKNFSREFKASVNDIAAETGIDEIKSSVERNKPKKFTDEMRDSINESIKADEEKDDKSET